MDQGKALREAGRQLKQNRKRHYLPINKPGRNWLLATSKVKISWELSTFAHVGAIDGELGRVGQLAQMVDEHLGILETTQRLERQHVAQVSGDVLAHPARRLPHKEREP